jgi:hypothetical protein
MLVFSRIDTSTLFRGSPNGPERCPGLCVFCCYTNIKSSLELSNDVFTHLNPDFILSFFLKGPDCVMWSYTVEALLTHTSVTALGYGLSGSMGFEGVTTP